jgi:competence protein ComEA
MRPIALLSVLSLSSPVFAQLPDAPGREEVEKLCRNCHELARSVSKKQDRDGWLTTFNKMVAFGMKHTDREMTVVIDYLTKHYAAEPVPPVNVNTAPAIELESRLGLRRSQAAALIKHRNANGNFRTIDDLKRVPGIDAERIEARRDVIVF